MNSSQDEIPDPIVKVSESSPQAETLPQSVKEAETPLVEKPIPPVEKPILPVEKPIPLVEKSNSTF